MTTATRVQPAPPDMLRSMKPYLMAGKSKIEGKITVQETNTGQKFSIYTPVGHENSTEAYPVLYHLHGAGMFWSWVHKELYWIAAAHEASVRAGKSRQMVIVSAYDPSKFSMWADSVDGSNNVASALHQDLMPYVEQNYKIKAERNSRFIQGFSMGGFGAATHAFKYQDMFGAVAIWDGALHDWNTISATRPKITANQFANSEDAFNTWSPWTSAKKADLSKTPVVIVSGLMVDFADGYTAFLQSLGAQVTRYTEDCMHEMKCLSANRGQSVFEFFEAVASNPKA